MRLRVTQLREWTGHLSHRSWAVLPYSLWLPGLFNPTSFNTAVTQVTARERGLPLDHMAVVTHFTGMQSASEADSYPPGGAYVHGLFMQGARWDEHGRGGLADSRPKELLPMLPGVYLAAVVAAEAAAPAAPSAGAAAAQEQEQEQEQEQGGAGLAGALVAGGDSAAHSALTYECPCYHTTARGPTYVFTATVRAENGDLSKWVLAGVAIIMQQDE
jgi:dynein heavy chain